jgi:hypothetical protein
MTQTNPYRDLPDYAFWRRGVATPAPSEVDPVLAAPFTISTSDAIATAGSCFAQYLASTLKQRGFNYFVTEPEPNSEYAINENYGVFPARFGNLYTTTQLRQLFERAYDIFSPIDDVWQHENGAFVDPFRPQIQSAGFPTKAAMLEDRRAHLAAVRRMFENCDVFIFTLGLTEAWLSEADDAAVPLPPGVSGSSTKNAPYQFRNLTVPQMTQDLSLFMNGFRGVNPGARVILTVSPVPLIATYENRHVLVSTIYSKSALRVVAEVASQEHGNIAYFPAYEIITGHHNRYRFFEDDLRSISADGVATVMDLFSRHYLRVTTEATDDFADLLALQEIVCEEEELDK